MNSSFFKNIFYATYCETANQQHKEIPVNEPCFTDLHIMQTNVWE